MKKYIISIVVILSALTICAQDTIRPLRVAMLLPMQTEVIKRDKNMDRFLDFYTGALLAVYEMQATGQPVELFTYDIGKSTRQLEQVLLRPEMTQIDLVLGPVYAAQVAIMADWALQHGVRTLLPFSADVPGLNTNPYVMQFNPSVQLEATAMVEHLVALEHPIHCIFVSADESTIPESVRLLREQITASQLPYAYTSVRQIMADSLSEVLNDTAENILLLNTERYAGVRTLMPHIARAAQGKQLTLFSRYSWQTEQIIIPQIFSTVFRKEVPVDSVSYGVTYRRFFAQPHSTSRPCYDLLGYDLMNYTLQTLQLLTKTKTETTDSIIGRPYEGLQSDLYFQRVGEGGYENRNVHIVRTK